MKKQKWIVILLTLALSVSMLAGCGSKKAAVVEYAVDTAPMALSKSDYSAEEISVGSNSVADFAVRSEKSAAAGGTQALPQNRKWIITMSINAEADDLDAALEGVAAQIAAAGGYVESQNINNNSSYRRCRSASMTIRIPADAVDSFVQEVSDITNVTSNSRNVQDITLAYTDTEGRVTALKTEEARLLELMAKAEDMSDLLEIEARLTEVRYQLERHASTLRLYDNQVDYATIDLYINEVAKYTPVEEPTFFQRISAGLSESITDLGNALVNLAAWIIVDLPYLILWGLVIFGAYRIIRRSLRKRKAKKAAKEQEK